MIEASLRTRYDQSRICQTNTRLLSAHQRDAGRRQTRRLATTLMMLLTVIVPAPRPVHATDLQIAEQTWQLGDYIAHANAVRTDFLAPEIADKFDIERSNETALITVSVQKADASAPIEPVEADVQVTATRSDETTEQVEMRTHRSDDDVYHLGVLTISDGEPVRFDLAIVPAAGYETYRFGFERYFFTD